MIDIILQILSVLGIILLVSLLVILALVLLILFFPITYRIFGCKDQQMYLSARVRWLFGLIHAKYEYPEPGRLIVKVLWVQVFDSGAANNKSAKNGAETSEAASNCATPESIPESSCVKKDKIADKEKPKADQNVSQSKEESHDTAAGEANTDNEGRTFQKIENLKYTIKSKYDKIKEIWENISYYIELLQEENTKQLFSHVCFRMGNILKSIRPRHIKADILFGTGAPDTTGYAYGVYGMLSPILGPKCIVVPDFEQAVLKGELTLSGHITVFMLLINALKLLLDKKLHKFIKKMKAGAKKTTA